jgi:hypothetical protein
MADDDLEREKLAFEKKKWKEQLDVENKKLWFSTGSIVIPLLVVAATIYANTLAQKNASQAAFELKVAEVILEPNTVTESKNRADGLVALFPTRLPGDFSERLGPLGKKLDRPEMDKRALLNVLIAAPKERRKEVLDLWLMFFPDDKELLPHGLVAFVESR